MFKVIAVYRVPTDDAAKAKFEDHYKNIHTPICLKIPGIKVEQEASFIFLLDQRKPTGPMAGVRIQDGKVDLIFINTKIVTKVSNSFWVSIEAKSFFSRNIQKCFMI